MRLANLAITTAQAAQVAASALFRDRAPAHVLLHANFTYGSGGTSADAWVQTSLDGGATWCDVANFHFTTASARKFFNLSSMTPVATQATPTDGSLAANTCVDGLVGPLWRVKYTTVGTYAGSTTLAVHIVGDGQAQAIQ